MSDSRHADATADDGTIRREVSMATASEVLRIAAGEIGYSRWTDPQPGTKYEALVRPIPQLSYYGASGVPFCAMFVSWVMSRAD